MLDHDDRSHHCPHEPDHRGQKPQEDVSFGGWGKAQQGDETAAVVTKNRRRCNKIIGMRWFNNGY